MNRYLFFLSLCLLGACVRPLDTIYADTDAGGWAANSPVFVYYENRDTTAVRDIDLVVRFNSLFNYDRFRFIMETTAPDGVSRRDTLQIEYRPDVSAAYTESSMPYISGADFNRAGVYRFAFRPLMPVSEIKGVAGVGITIIEHGQR